MNHFHYIYSSIEDEIINLFFNKDNKIISSRLKISFLSKYPKLHNYILNRYKDSESIAETLYRIKDHIEIRPVCPVCGNKLPFCKGKFIKHCSIICAANDINTRNKTKNTMLIKYGVENPWQSKEIRNKIKKTCKERYGVESASQSEEIKNKIKKTCKERYGVDYYFQSKDCAEKTKKYCQDNFGVNYISQIEYIKKKVKATCLDRYGADSYSKTDLFKESYKNTCIKKYGTTTYLTSNECKQKYLSWCLKNFGVDHYSKTKEFINKVKNTNLNNYGVNFYFQTNEFKLHLKNIFNEKYNGKWYSQTDEWYNKTIETSLKKYGLNFYSQSEEFKNVFKNRKDEIQEKMQKSCLDRYNKKFYSQCDEFKIKTYNTRRQNNSFNVSKSEDILYEYLLNIYPDTIRQYKSDLYPFACDFYIPSKDLYIEYNGTWTHGGHPFNNIDINDLSKLQLWSSKNTDFYKNAIYTWTDLDIRKRNIAKENNLKYLEIWPSNWTGRNPKNEIENIKFKIYNI